MPVNRDPLRQGHSRSLFVQDEDENEPSEPVGEQDDDDSIESDDSLGEAPTQRPPPIRRGDP